jgi:glutamate 5-kinase
MSKTIVLKLGTSSICHEVTHVPLLSTLSRVVETIIQLKSLGHRVILVSSGAIGTGLRALHLPTKPTEMAKKQAVAAVGQGKLISMYDQLFSMFGQPIAQVLLTRGDLTQRNQYLNACNTLMALLDMDIVPIVNENDTVSFQEIKIGDNDTLSAITAAMVHADYLFLMTDVDCLYTNNPRTHPDAQPVRVVHDIARLKESIVVSSPGSALGTGGMMTKLVAADLATVAGVTTIIARGTLPEHVIRIVAGDEDPVLLYTCFPAKKERLGDLKWWIQHGIHPYGTVYIDAGAVRGIVLNKGSLYAAGVTGVKGNFVVNQCVHVCYQPPNGDDVYVARGLVNYNSSEIARVKGLKSADMSAILGDMDTETIIDRGNLARLLTPNDIINL